MSLRSWLSTALIVFIAAASTSLHAQQPATSPAAAVAPTPVREWPAGRSFPVATDEERKIQAAFEQVFVDGFEELTVYEIAKRVEAKGGCTVVVKTADFETGGVDPQAKLSGKARTKSVRAELREFLEDHDLAAAVRDECLQITTTDHAETSWETLRVYQVHDLVVAPNDPTADRPDLEQLQHRITSFCSPSSWRSNGGTLGEIRAVEAPGLLGLAIVQREEVHEQVEELLAMLRGARLAELGEQQESVPAPPIATPPPTSAGGFGSAPVPPPQVPPPPPLPRGKVVYTKEASEQRIYDALRRPAKFTFSDEPLEKIVAKLNKDEGIDIEFDIPALTADGKGAETTLSLHWTGGSLRSGLKMLLEPQGLTTVVEKGRLLITTKTAAEVIELTRVYQVHDLFPRDLSFVGQKPDFHTLKWLVLDLISPEAWRDGGGEPGAIQGFETGGAQVLIIQITEAVHEQVQAFFELIRDAKEPMVYEAQRRRGAATPPPQQQQAAAPSAATESAATQESAEQVYSNKELGFELRVGGEWKLKSFPPGGQSDGRLMADSIFHVARRTPDNFGNLAYPQFWATAIKLKPDEPQTAVEYLAKSEQRRRADASILVVPSATKIEAVTLNGMTYAKMGLEFQPREVGRVQGRVYLVVRKQHALGYLLLYDDAKDLAKLEGLLSAIKYEQ